MSSRPDGTRPEGSAFGVACGAAVFVAAAIALAARAAPIHYDAPAETAMPAPGPNVELVRTNCIVCHSFDYITMQPRGLADPTAFWTAEVNKMRTVYGASIDPDNVKPIVAYLVAVYGK